MIVIVGHGPSILSGLGSVIDSHTVVRLKHGRVREPKNWGVRTDYLCGRSRSFEKPGIPFWFFGGAVEQKWLAYFDDFNPRIETDFGALVAKPSHGLCAAFCAVEYLKPAELAFIGCDTLLDPSRDFCKWWGRPTIEHQAEYEAIHGSMWKSPHDWHAEHRALHSLGVRIMELTHAQQEQGAGAPDGSLCTRIGLRELPADESREGVQQGRQEERHLA